jgi:hypothetical protein
VRQDWLPVAGFYPKASGSERVDLPLLARPWSDRPSEGTAHGRSAGIRGRGRRLPDAAVVRNVRGEVEGVGGNGEGGGRDVDEAGAGGL